MAREPQAYHRRKDTYRYHTQRPINCLAFVGPLLVLFQAGAMAYESHLLVPHYLAKVLGYFGATGEFLPALLIVAVLLIMHMAHRDPWRIQPKALAGMFAESILWSLPLIAMSYLIYRQADAGASIAALPCDDVARPVLQAIGAGIYEEFIFRLIFISFVLLILVDIFRLRKDIVTIAAVIVGAVIFSLCHFSIEQITGRAAFDWGKFTVLAIAGVLWGGLFVFRGFGIAVGSHIVYDLFVVAIRLQDAPAA